MVRPRRTGRGLGIPPRATPPGRGGRPFTFIAPRRLSDEPLTRARVRLLGPCFKTGRVGSRHRRRPRALGSALSRERRDRRNPPGPTARRRPGRTEDSPPRPRDPPRRGERWESGRAVGGAARPPPEGGEESAATGYVRFPRPRDSASCCCQGGCNTRGGETRRPRVGAVPPEPPSPPGLPSRPGAGRGAPPTVEVRPAAAGRRPRGGPPPTPPPAPPARRRRRRPPGGRRRERRRAGGGVGRNGERERSARRDTAGRAPPG